MTPGPVGPGSIGLTDCSDTPKADVVGRALRLAFAPAPRHEADAVIVAAQKRAAALHALGHARLQGIVTARRAPRVPLSRRGRVPGLIPVRTPFPDIAGHVVEAKTVGGK